MYPFYVKGKKVFSFAYKPNKGGVVKDDDTGKWYEILRVEQGRGRKIFGKETYNMDNSDEGMDKNEIIVIRTGYMHRGENWNGFVNGFFEYVVEAEEYLENQGYKHNYDDVYSNKYEEETTLLAKIERLSKLNPND